MMSSLWTDIKLYFTTTCLSFCAHASREFLCIRMVSSVCPIISEDLLKLKWKGFQFSLSQFYI